MKLTEKLHDFFINLLVRFFPIRVKTIKCTDDNSWYGFHGLDHTVKTKEGVGGLHFDGLLPPGDDED